MKRSLPPLGWFRAFESAARLQSFTAAADELSVTQSAISQQIRSLESHLNCRLFDRKHRGIGLTDDGRKLLPDITRAIDAIHSATIPFGRQADSTVLTVATSVSVAQWYLAPAIAKCMQREPGIQIRLLTSVWPDEISDATDIQIRFGPSVPNAQTLGRNRLVLVASPTLFNQKKTKLTNTLLKKHAIIQAVGTSDTWANTADKFNLDPSRDASLYVDSHGLAVDLARSGSGIALTSELIALPSIVDGSLVCLHDKTVDANDGYWVSVTSERSEDTANRFVNWLLDEVLQFQNSVLQ